MAPPVYQGQGQPSADTGGSWFGRLGSFLGGGTPSYTGAGQPASGGNGASTVAYATAPAQPPLENVSDVEASTCPIDPMALAAGHIAIVVPRDR
ncbi:MAG: hypothetical protein KF773_12295 [Deltaproteobacteria bacterium]|nr:hypothetical protein [Deltaproteobacteria bacterium]